MSSSTHPTAGHAKPPKPPRPNILLITCDQYRFPRFSYGPEGGFHHALKEILGFQGTVDASNPYAKFFPGLLRLRKNAVVLRNHTIAASACTPSRAVIYTGQYGTRTGVTQTDGMFKNGDASNFPWLAADGIPTLGTWMQQAGYSTHYFGKWHVSNPPEHSLKRYGFDNWEPSYPEPHGAAPNNLGVFRDVGFTDDACAFIRRQGLALNYNRVTAQMQANDPSSNGPPLSDIKPWFAVASFTNPHDIATYPGVIGQALPSDKPGQPQTIKLPGGKKITLPAPKTQPIMGPLHIPRQGDVTPPPTAGTIQIPLNPLGFPQDCARKSPTQDEDLKDKPSCQHDYAYKMGLALAAKGGFNLVDNIQSATGSPLTQEQAEYVAIAAGQQMCLPFQLTDKPDANALVFLQMYAWLHAVVDKHINAVLTALEESGQADNTIVMFLADHGEYGAAHGMMLEKWHTAYAEALHVPVVVNYRPLSAYPGYAQSQGAKGPLAGKKPPKDHPAHGDVLRQCDALTSHVDILPTVLGLTGLSRAEIAKLGQELSASRPVPPLPGVDLSPLIRGEWDPGTVIEHNGSKRKGVLFITDDEITAPLSFERSQNDIRSWMEYDVYLKTVELVRHGTPKKPGVEIWPGSVRQPNHVRCVRTADYKLARYIDPSAKERQEWEMYDLKHDANETTTLVHIHGEKPKAREKLPKWTDKATVQKMANELAVLLAELEARFLS